MNQSNEPVGVHVSEYVGVGDLVVVDVGEIVKLPCSRRYSLL